MANSELLNFSKILIVDDEPQMRKLLHMAFSTYQSKIIEAHSGSEGIALFQQYSPDLVILDMNLGDIRGEKVLEEIRKISECPVIFLSVENDGELIIQMLNQGADDYISKPFDINQLIARSIAVLRRFKKKEMAESVFRHEHLEVHLLNHQVFVNGNEIKLTSTEFDLLKYFILNKGKVLTHRQILKEVWGPSFVEHTQYPRVYVRHLRSKIEIDANSPVLIITEAGIGYRFV